MVSLAHLWRGKTRRDSAHCCAVSYLMLAENAMPLKCRNQSNIKPNSAYDSHLKSFAILPQALANSGVGMALFAFVEPTVPTMVPSPMVPTPGVAPRSHVPSAVVAKICVNTAQVVLVVPSTVYILAHVPTVGDCDAAKVVATPPPAAAAACGSGSGEAVVMGRKARTVIRSWRRGCMLNVLVGGRLQPANANRRFSGVWPRKELIGWNLPDVYTTEGRLSRIELMVREVRGDIAAVIAVAVPAVH